MDGCIWRIFAFLLFISTYTNAFQIRHQRPHPTRHHHGRLKRQHEGPGEVDEGRYPGYDFGDSNSEPESFIWGGPRAEEGAGSGQWGPWEAPSSCSRSCGGGVASQARRCNDYSEDGQPLCRGADLRYFSCNIQPCPQGSIDFRTQQCSEFDERLFNDRYYKWVPYLHTVGKCELNCMPQNERFYYRHRRKVTDGTTCDDETGAICVDGKCTEVGCDKLLGSTAREDECGVCWGNGSTCVTKSASYDVNTLKPGYNDILLIPAGATNIKVRESRGSNNYLAMRNATGHYFFNGNYRIDYPRVFEIAGTKFHYERPEHKIQPPQSITAKGPTTEGVYLVILFQDRGPPVDYEYSVPRDIAPRSDPHTYSWVYGQFGECSSSCGGGYQTRSVACVRTSDNEQADEELCEFGLRPAGSQQCAPDPCPPAWVTDEWQPCSESCGGNGTQTRQVYCGQVIAGGVPSVVSDHICVEKDGPKPATSQPCGREVICPTWHVGPWKPCDRLCGDGVQSREVTCFVRRDGKIEILPDPYCRSDKPEAVKSCNLHPCDGVDWVTSEWSGCDESCGLTFETREVQCSTKEGQIYPDKFCHGYRKPKLKRECKASKECDFEWFASQWSKCSAKCGTGVQSRKVFCSTRKNDTLKIVEDGKCDAKLKYETTQNCTATDKCQGAWYYGPWNECSKPCGGGNMSRKAVCVMNNQTVAWSNCDSDKFQSETDSCNKQACGEESSTTETATEMSSTVEPTEEPSSEEEDCEAYEDEDEETSTELTDEATDSTESVTADSSTESSVTESSQSSETSTVGSSVTSEAGTEGSTVTGATEATETEVSTEESTATKPVDVGDRSGVSLGETVQSDAPSSGATDGTSAISTSAETSVGTTTTEASTAAETTSEASTTDSATSTTVASTSDATTTEKSTTLETTTEAVTSTTAAATTTVATTVVSSSSSSSSGTDASTTEASTTAAAGASSTDGSSATEDSTKTSVEASSVPSTIGETTTEAENATETTGTAGSAGTEGTSESSSPESSTTGKADLSTAGTEGTTEAESTTSTLFDDLGATGEIIKERIGLGKRKCKKRKPKRKKKDSKKCRASEFGCCWDGFSVAKGPFGEGCTSPQTCKDTEFGCCPDEVSPAEGPDGDGCPKSLCAESLFGCCQDKKTFSKGNNFEGCPEPEFIAVNCKETEFGCCPDGVKPASGPKYDGCFECEGSGECSSCRDTKFGCCPDGERAATGPKQAGCKQEKCVKSKYGCCPDGKTPAKGKKNKGCPKSACADEKFGCCPDAITPAHGPAKEGCCLLSPFGCCPDNITPARGTHNEGCGCENTKFGCCPNNVTAAQGKNNEGCGCSYSTHGCCPDGITVAPGPNYEGCECFTYQFGCCPDGVTIAKGASGEGCSCQETEFGCCSDGTTPAKGADGAGCTCAESRFGCCPDGVSEAKGPNFEECSDVPVLPGDLCVLPKDKGPCRNFSVKWHYDKDYGGCTRFWYGGCEGNQNRFNSQGDCTAVCIQPKGRDVCKLPNIKGPCEGYYPVWFYDSELKQCRQFIHGGCLGNGNKFETRDECHNLCVEPDIGDPCELPVEVGICNGSHSRWFFSKEHHACVPFTYGGCQGNRNNFQTEKACEQRCIKPGQSREVCSLPQAKGACSKKLARWSYDQSLDKCVPFYYTGCEANGNNFVGRKDCETSCPSRVERSICTLPADIGACHNYTQRWYYNTLDAECKPFHYGNCGGNHNNFHSFQECKRYCSGRPTEPQLPVPQPTQPAYTPVPPEPDRQPSRDTRICFINPVDERDCGQSETKYYYDASTGTCKRFMYTGCGETRNVYDTAEECEGQCGNAQEPCDLPAVEGPCRATMLSYYYDRNSDTCQEFNYGGCEGNANRFEQRRDCEARCVRDPSRTSDRVSVPTSPSGLPADCGAYPDGGKCKDYVAAWYFNSTSGRCGRFAYGGCSGNGNHFISEEQCNRTCGDLRGIDVCNLQHDIGSCGDVVDKFFFDSQNGICRPFTYSGCGGNGNRFDSSAECEALCLRRSELDLDMKENEIDQQRPAKDNCDAAREECSQLVCPYGIEQWVDGANCDRCRCRTPCHEQACPRGTRCNIVPQRSNLPPYTVQYGAECIPESKPGECPEVTSDSCEQDCYSDADCGGDEKCCYNGCGYRCSRPRGYEPSVPTQPPDEPAPPIVHVPEPQVNASEGNIATLRCIATGFPIPTITWEKDAVILETSGHYRIVVDGSLQIINLKRTDSGTYICVADNKVGPPIQKIFELQVTDPIPQAAQILGDDRAVLIVRLGAPTVLHCHAYGYPAPRINWWQANTTVPLSSELYEQRNDYSLLIREVRLNTLGPYTCQAYNGNGRATSWTITVKAEGSVSNPSPTERQYIQYLIPPSYPVTTLGYGRDDRPLTTAPPRSFVAPVVVDISSTLTQYPVGSNISLPCIVNGFPQPTVEWLKDGQPVQLSSRVQHSGNNTLDIFDATISDAGKYTCKAANEYQTDSRDITIQVDTMFIHPKCVDNPQFANCALIVKGNYCKHQYYARFCCKSCTLQGQLPIIGTHLQEIGSSKGGDLSRSRRHFLQEVIPSFATPQSLLSDDDSQLV